MVTWSSSPEVPHTGSTFDFPPNNSCKEISYIITYTDNDGCSKSTYFDVKGQTFSCDNVTGTFIQLNNGAYDNVKIGEVFWGEGCVQDIGTIESEYGWINDIDYNPKEDGDGIDVYASVTCNPMNIARTNTITISIEGEEETCTKTFEITQQAGSHTGDYVEIAGVKWATKNVGASSVTDYGLYFAWGDKSGYTASQVGVDKTFGWPGYVWGRNATKYNSDDGLTTLELSDDGAHVILGDKWRMPTKDEFVALGNSVNTAWVNNYNGTGVAGLICSDKTDSCKVLFFPANGFAGAADLEVNPADVGIDCNYWSSNVTTSGVYRYEYAYYFLLTMDTTSRDYIGGNPKWDQQSYRCTGRAIRPVYDDSLIENIAKLTLDNGNVINIEGSGELTASMVEDYKETTVKAEITSLCTSIGNSVFEYFTSMTSCTISDSVTSIGNYAFNNCRSLTSITIPNGVTSIGINSFGECSGLTSVIIGSGVTSIGNYAFSHCSSLTSITIPNSVTSIGNSAFGYCSGLTSIDIPNSVTSIDDYAFYGCSSLTTCTIGSGVTYIGGEAFRGCSSLTSITIPNSVTRIDNSAFLGCTSLESITAEATTPASLSVSAFGNTNNCPIYVPCESLNAYKAAWYTYKSRITCGGEYIAILTSNNGDVTGIIDTENGILINRQMLDYRETTVKAEITSRCTSIGDNAFYIYTSMTSCTIPDSVTSIGYYAFSRCSGLTSIGPIGSGASVEIPNSVTSIGGGAFSSCTSLTSIDIPSGVTRIGQSAFDNCSGLTSITVEATTPASLSVSAFDNTNNCPIYVPCESVDAYKAATNWSTYANRITSLCVDLGLPSGTLWAKYNVGATTETEYGNYYQYGKGAAQYSATSGQSDYSGTEDPLSTSVDTARQVMGAGWHMPTSAQWQELIDQCTWTWTTSGGTNGYSVSKNGKSIFFPAAGYLYRGTQYSVGNGCFYWSSSPSDKYGNQVYYLRLDNGYIGILSNYRVYGYLVRGVIG